MQRNPRVSLVEMIKTCHFDQIVQDYNNIILNPAPESIMGLLFCMKSYLIYHWNDVLPDMIDFINIVLANHFDMCLLKPFLNEYNSIINALIVFTGDIPSSTFQNIMNCVSNAPPQQAIAIISSISHFNQSKHCIEMIYAIFEGFPLDIAASQVIPLLWLLFNSPSCKESIANISPVLMNALWTGLIRLSGTKSALSHLFSLMRWLTIQPFFDISLPILQNTLDPIFSNDANPIDIENIILSMSALIFNFSEDITNMFLAVIYRLIDAYSRTGLFVPVQVRYFLQEFWDRFHNEPKIRALQQYFTITDDATFYISCVADPAIFDRLDDVENHASVIGAQLFISALDSLSRSVRDPLPNCTTRLINLLLEDHICEAGAPLADLFEGNNDPTLFLSMLTIAYQHTPNKIARQAMRILSVIFLNAESLQEQIVGFCMNCATSEHFSLPHRAEALECLPADPVGFSLADEALSSTMYDSYTPSARYIRHHVSALPIEIAGAKYAQMCDILGVPGVLSNKTKIELARTIVAIFRAQPTFVPPDGVIMGIFSDPDEAMQVEAIRLAHDLSELLPTDLKMTQLAAFRHTALYTTKIDVVTAFFDFATQMASESFEVPLYDVLEDLFGNEFECFRPTFYFAQLPCEVFDFIAACPADFVVPKLLSWFRIAPDNLAIEIFHILRKVQQVPIAEIAASRLETTTDIFFAADLIETLIAQSADPDYLAGQIDRVWDTSFKASTLFAPLFVALCAKQPTVATSKRDLLEASVQFFTNEPISVHALLDLVTISEALAPIDQLQYDLIQIFVDTVVTDGSGKLGKCIDRIEQMAEFDQAAVLFSGHRFSSDTIEQLISIIPSLADLLTNG